MYGLLIKLYFKRSLRLFISLLLVLMLSFSLGFSVKYLLPSQDVPMLAWVSADQGALTDILLNSITENVKDFRIIECSEEEAKQGLENGPFVATLRLPEQSGERLDRGEELVIELQYADISATLRRRLSYYVNQFIYSFNRAQAETELSYSLLDKHGHVSDDTLAGIFPNAVKNFAIAFLARSQALESPETEDTASALPWYEYVTDTLILLFIFFASHAFSQTFSKDWKDGLAQRLAKHRKTRWAFMLCSSAIQSVFLGILFFVLLFFGKSSVRLPQDFLLLFLFLIVVIFTNNTLALLLAKKGKASELQLIVALVILFGSGLLLPLSFFPSPLYRLAQFNPFSRIHQYLLYERPYSLWPFIVALLLLFLSYELASRRALKSEESRLKKIAFINQEVRRH